MSDRRWLGSVSGVVAMNPAIDVTAKAVYLALAVHADLKTGECFPSIGTIAAGIGKARSTVSEALNRLETHGVVSRTHRFVDGRQTTTVYTLLDIQSIRSAR